MAGIRRSARWESVDGADRDPRKRAVGLETDVRRAISNQRRETTGTACHLTIDFQFLAICSAVRQATACSVSVGFRAPLVPIPIPLQSRDSEPRETYLTK